MILLILAKAANVGVPLLLKEIVDALDASQRALLTLPLTLLLGYGLLRLSSSLFGELRDAVFAKVTQRAMRRVALRVFRHLHALARSAGHLQAARAHLQAAALELYAEELRLAHDALGEITGHMHADELLGEIFARFCIGK